MKELTKRFNLLPTDLKNIIIDKYKELVKKDFNKCLDELNQNFWDISDVLGGEYVIYEEYQDIEYHGGGDYFECMYDVNNFNYWFDKEEYKPYYRKWESHLITLNRPYYNANYSKASKERTSLMHF